MASFGWQQESAGLLEPGEEPRVAALVEVQPERRLPVGALQVRPVGVVGEGGSAVLFEEDEGTRGGQGCGA